MLQLINQLDVTILLYVQEHIRNSIMTPVLKLITSLGDGGAVWLFLILCLLLHKRTRRTGITALVAFVIVYITNDLMLKNVIARARPFDVLSQLHILIKPPTDYSFPSGHTAISFAVAGVICSSGDRKWKIGALLLAFIMGFSRIYVGVHYPSDVICGAIEGFIISLLVSLYSRYHIKD